MPTAKRKAKSKVDVSCPMCGLERPKGEPVYSCVTCGSEGYDCCVAGNGTECPECQEKGA